MNLSCGGNQRNDGIYQGGQDNTIYVCLPNRPKCEHVEARQILDDSKRLIVKCPCGGVGLAVATTDKAKQPGICQRCHAPTPTTSTPQKFLLHFECPVVLASSLTKALSENPPAHESVSVVSATFEQASNPANDTKSKGEFPTNKKSANQKGTQREPAQVKEPATKNTERQKETRKNKAAKDRNEGLSLAKASENPPAYESVSTEAVPFEQASNPADDTKNKMRQSARYYEVIEGQIIYKPCPKEAYVRK